MLDPTEQYELQFAPDEVQALSRNELRVFDALAPGEGEGRAAEVVAAEAGLPLPLTVHLLVELVRRGMVVREGVAWSRACP